MSESPRPAVFVEALGWPLLHSGKVRELYAIPGREDVVCMVATDAISAFDHVLSPGIPGKGALLTAMSLWWFEQLDDIVENHLVSTDVPDVVAGRAMVVEKLDMIPVEAVARGYLTGSAWAEYQEHGTACGIELPAGLHDGSRLPKPIFTPAMKAAYGEHDENVDFETMVATTGRELGERLRDVTLALYERAERIAREHGLVLADTKVEFGLRGDGTLVLGDEVLTPDSSRYWDADAWSRGELESFDKQYLRDWLLTSSGWDKASDVPPPPLPADVVEATAERYRDALTRLTGAPLP